MPIDLKSLPIDRPEIDAALRGERRPAIRKRLLALRAVLNGQTSSAAARAAKATPGSVDRWLRQTQRSGIQSLLVDGRHGHAKRRMKPGEVDETRRQIATALAGPLKPEVRARLIAVDTVLSGRPIDEAAVSARVLPNAVKSWLRVITHDGIAPTLARWEGQGKPRPRQLDADPVALRELAAKEMNARIRKRMLALACVAEGMGVYDAEVRVGLNRSAITKRVRRFREEGVAAFQDRKTARRPRKLDVGQRSKPGRRKVRRDNLNVKEPHAVASGVKNARGRPRKLSSAQLAELRDYVLKWPETSFWRLHRLVWNRFHVRHSHASLKRLLKSEFGIVWTGASKKLGEGLNLAELQQALASTTDWRMKKRLKALIELVKGGNARRVARANQVNLETLRKWAKRYRTQRRA